MIVPEVVLLFTLVCENILQPFVVLMEFPAEMFPI